MKTSSPAPLLAGPTKIALVCVALFAAYVIALSVYQHHLLTTRPAPTWDRAEMIAAAERIESEEAR